VNIRLFKNVKHHLIDFRALTMGKRLINNATRLLLEAFNSL
jgi:hypothetical protein